MFRNIAIVMKPIHKPKPMSLSLSMPRRYNCGVRRLLKDAFPFPVNTDTLYDTIIREHHSQNVSIGEFSRSAILTCGGAVLGAAAFPYFIPFGLGGYIAMKLCRRNVLAKLTSEITDTEFNEIVTSKWRPIENDIYYISYGIMFSVCMLLTVFIAILIGLIIMSAFLR